MAAVSNPCYCASVSVHNRPQKISQMLIEAEQTRSALGMLERRMAAAPAAFDRFERDLHEAVWTPDAEADPTRERLESLTHRIERVERRERAKREQG